MDRRFSCLTPGLDWTRLFMSLTAGAGTRCMSLLPDSPTLYLGRKGKDHAKEGRKQGKMNEKMGFKGKGIGNILMD